MKRATTEATKQAPNNVCRECRDGLEHCHGTVVRHALVASECTDDCATPDALHTFSIDCEAIGCACSVSTAAGVAS